MSEKESYLLDRNAVEIRRIMKQYKATTAALGGLIAPELTGIVNQPLTAVLDIGCGTCDWLADVHEQYPGVKHVAGLDISDKMFLEDRSRFDLRLGSVLDPLPEDWNAAFDLVNIRYVFLWIDSKNWSRVLENVKKVLKPGGVVQVGFLYYALFLVGVYVTHYFVSLYRLLIPTGEADREPQLF
jgi:SAM-dependent methyltransferase